MKKGEEVEKEVKVVTAVRLTPTELDKLDDLAVFAGVNRSEMMRRLINLEFDEVVDNAT